MARLDFPVAVAPTTAMTCVPMPPVCPGSGRARVLAGCGARVAAARGPGDGGAREGASGALATSPGGPAARVPLVLAGVSLQVELHEHRMHDGLLPPSAAFLPARARRAGGNTCDLHDSRTGRYSAAFATLALAHEVAGRG